MHVALFRKGGAGQTNPNNLDKQCKIKATSQDYENPNPSEGDGVGVFPSFQFNFLHAPKTSGGALYLKILFYM